MCNCECGWRFFTDARRSFVCPKCEAVIECDGPTAPVQSKRPTWVRQVEKYKTSEDIGVGDTVERLTGVWGQWFKYLMDKWGVDCGCGNRRKRWNELYPYSKSSALPVEDKN